jgi:hypothetical protein
MLAGGAAAQKPYAIPESPAFTFLDATPAQISRPTTARAFAAAVLNGASPLTGELQQGVALDVAPWSFVPGLRIPLSEYQSSRSRYVLANTQLSHATVRASGDTSATDLAAGVRITLVDRSDPMSDTAFTGELRRRLRSCLPDQPTDAAVAQAQACGREQAQALRKQWLSDRGHWNDASLAAAAAGGWRFARSQLSDGVWQGWAGWITGAMPLGRGGQVIGQLRYNAHQGDQDDGLAYGGRALYGSAEMNGFVEVAGGSRTGGRPSRADWTGGLEFKAAENLWISTGFGSRSNAAGGNRGVLVADLRWQLASGPTIGGAAP